MISLNYHGVDIKNYSVVSNEFHIQPLSGNHRRHYGGWLERQKTSRK